MVKFKIGDKVRCIGEGQADPTRGYGWKKGLEFIVTNITNEEIYWKGNKEAGVFENYLELAIREEIIYE